MRRRLRRSGGEVAAGEPGDQIPRIEPRRNPRRARRLEDFSFHAVIGTWMEADVIAATVRNAFTQGAERVFLVDNDSPDNTVEEATAAGAELMRTFSSDGYDDVRRVTLMQEVVDEVSAAGPLDHVWWLWLDADEFPHGPFGLTIREYLATLDARFRIVGTAYYEHFPHQKPEYVPGCHPVGFQPFCELNDRERRCALHCRSHPLRRWDRSGPAIRPKGAGLHTVECATRPLLEPSQPIFVHHHPFRAEETTRERLAALCALDDRGWSRNRPNDERVWSGVSSITKRWQNLDAVYEQRWGDVDVRRGGGPPGVEPVPWDEAVPERHRHFVSWSVSPDTRDPRG